MAILHITRICRNDNTIIATVFINGIEETITTTVSENMLSYVTDDRCDAFVFGLLFFAMSHGFDIKSDIPISEDLYYNIQNHFIDALASPNSGLYRTHLYIPIIPCCEHIDTIVATGGSCGVDALYTLKVHDSIETPTHKITHLAFYNVGSHHTGMDEEKDKALYEGRYNNCKKFAEEYGYTLYSITSDIYKLIDRYGGYSHITNHSYMAAFCILLLQKGISRYYYSAGYPYSDFKLLKAHKTEELDSAKYDLLTFFTISIGQMKVYSTGGSIKRIDKTRAISTYQPAHKYLNVCVRESFNEGDCFKCIRTMLSIDAVGHLDDFKDVFNVEKYQKNKNKYLRKSWISAFFYHDDLSKEILPLYKNKLTFFFKGYAVLETVIQLFRR